LNASPSPPPFAHASAPHEVADAAVVRLAERHDAVVALLFNSTGEAIAAGHDRQGFLCDGAARLVKLRRVEIGDPDLDPCVRISLAAGRGGDA